MNEWGVVLVIISLVGLIATIVTPLLKLNTSITKLNVTMENLNGVVLESRNKLESHEVESRKTLANHEKRITKLELKGGEK